MVMSIGWNPYFDNSEKTIVGDTDLYPSSLPCLAKLKDNKYDLSVITCLDN